MLWDICIHLLRLFFRNWFATYRETKTSSDDTAERVQGTVLEVDQQGREDVAVEADFSQRFLDMADLDFLGNDGGVVTLTLIHNLQLLGSKMQALGAGVVNQEDQNDKAKEDSDHTENDHKPKLEM